MKKKTLIAIIPALVMVVGCSSESPKPNPNPKAVAAKKNQASKAVGKKAPLQAVAPKSSAGPATYAIEQPNNSFKVEPTNSVIHAEPITATTESVVAPVVGAASVAASTVQAQAVALPAYVTETARVPVGTSPAVVALIREADRNQNSGDLDGAVTSMERALRIDARNPTLTYKLAQLRLKQNKPQQAEELAGKAALLAGGDLDLKRKSWLLIAESRRLQQNPQGAKDAKAKADSFFGH